MRARQVPWEQIGPVRWSVRCDTAIVVVDGQLDPSDAPGVCAALHARLSGSGVVSVICRGKGLVEPDLATVDLLARMTLCAHRFGCMVRVEDPSPRLRELLDLAGLGEQLGPCGSGAEAWWQAEEGEQPFGVEEGVEPDDRPV